jgi:cation/acetate symporter
VYYLVVNTPAFRAGLGLQGPGHLWLGIQSVSAGVFGVPVGFVVTWLASQVTKR